jgi:hypothetical protein
MNFQRPNSRSNDECSEPPDRQYCAGPWTDHNDLRGILYDIWNILMFGIHGSYMKIQIYYKSFQHWLNLTADFVSFPWREMPNLSGQWTFLTFFISMWTKSNRGGLSNFSGREPRSRWNSRPTEDNLRWFKFYLFENLRMDTKLWSGQNRNSRLPSIIFIMILRF